ncbi:(R,R)-butanediol dehydrogenase / meso-butanediol dehydrogenase / diacetyl reductase [Anaerovirgula multivorans]|uniref:(R,R)-butanediol dehydrogenase / meso-butanediol dehydrogenase / diacetyl reductase n=1 Tax=Anaerovirgula multivorans TaxID=312168 RepID=A0A239CD79_9FIRM|nr:2,3-butanediol dehydrogenase [Anaerovirgula multivorans]SNS18157.1 (R,R)-butanediol dehydrogenase / meso-butanediol dehydrogenase / diacetyl reductase [Anaerovirgula multivorans]
MKAAVWYGKKDVRIMDVPEPPTPDKGKVKIKVQWCGICGSDLHEYLAGPIFIPTAEPHPLTGDVAPIILGHEFSGEIVEVGPEVKGFKVGDRVAPDACHVCHECNPCKIGKYNVCEKLAFTGLMTNGAFAEYVVVPDYTLYKIPDNMTYETAALLEPLSVGIHAVRQAPIVQGESVVIFGAGTIGLVTLQAVRAAGASKVYVVEVAKVRRAYAKQMGATEVFDPNKVDIKEKIKEVTKGVGADVVFECIGSEKVTPIAIEVARTGGKIVTVGVYEKETSLNFNNIVFKDKHIIGSLGYAKDFAIAIDLINDGRINVEPLITGKIKIDDLIKRGFDELINRKEENIKILVTPW